MKLASVRIGNDASFGVVTDNHFKDLAKLLGGRCVDLRSLLAQSEPSEIAELANQAPSVPLSEISFDSPIPNADTRIFALGWSYGDHQVETSKPPPAHPFIFLKAPSAVVGHGNAIQRPSCSVKFDYEGEIAIVLRGGGQNLNPDVAHRHIGGYTLFMDGSVRDWQEHSVTAGKNFDRSSSFGPYIVTPDEIEDAGQIELRTVLNGAVMQRAKFADMVWKVEELIAYLSSMTELRAGDVISTGTPAGVGHKRSPPVYMRPGDVIEVSATGLGTLRNEVIDGP